MARAAKSVEGFRKNVFSLNSTVGTLTRAFGVGLGVGTVTALFAEASREADKLDASMRKLSATAKITGTDFGVLNQTATNAKTAFGLSTVVANDLTVELTKLADKAGDVAQATPGLRAFLDLGAARGLSAAQTLQAVQQSILGIDEGTDKLFNANPSVLYARFAESIGTTAGKLTEAQKAQALLTAALEDGGKVVGEYAAYLETAAGQAEKLQTELDDAQAALGELIAPARLSGIKALTATLQALFTREGWSETTSFWRDFFDPAGAQGRAVDRGIAAVMTRLTAAPPAAAGPAADPAAPFSEVVGELEKEVKLLQEAIDLGVARGGEAKRLVDIERRLAREIEKGTHSLGDQVAAARILQSMRVRIEFDPAALDAELRDLRAEIQSALDREFQTTVRIETESTHGGRILNARGGFGLLGPDRSARESGFFGASPEEIAAREDLLEVQREELKLFNERIAAGREIISAFGDLADAAGGLSEGLAKALRGAESALAGVSRIRASQDLGGFAGLLGTLSGGLSVGAGLTQMFAGLTDDSAERERRAAIRNNTEALDALRKQLAGDSLLSRVETLTEGVGLIERIAAYVGQDPQNYQTRLAAGDKQAFDDLLALSGIQVAPGYFEALNEWIRLTLEGIESTMVEDVGIRTLLAEGRDAEVDAMRRQKAREEELAVARLLGNDALIESLTRLYELEDAAREAAEAVAEAARQFGIAMTDFEIGARRAALAGNDREAFMLRSEAAARREQAQWEEAYEKNEITIDQLAALTEIINAELTKAVEDFDAAVNDLRKNLTDDLELRKLIQGGDDRGAALFRNQQEWDDFIAEAVAAGMDQGFIDSANEYFQGEANRINAAFDAAAVEGLIRDVSGRTADPESSVVRNARSITSMQASTLADIGWSQLSVLQEIAANTRVGLPGGAYIPSAGPTTVQNTGQQIHVHLHAGNIIGPDDVVGFVIDGVSRALGQEELDTATQDGSAFVP